MDYFNEFGRAETLLDPGPAIADAPSKLQRPKKSAQLASERPHDQPQPLEGYL